MKRLTKTLVVALSVVVVGTALFLVLQKSATGAGTAAAAAAPLPVVCRPAHGTIHSVFTTQNCASPVGLRTTGTTTDAGLLDGSTTFTALAVALSAGLPMVEPQANLAYSGQLTIVASRGTLVTNDLGVLDANHLAFTEIERPASGTGVFANPGNSVFFISLDPLSITGMDFRGT